jgi:AraC-like DNA-binding protein
LGEIAVGSDTEINAAKRATRVVDVVCYVESHYAEPCSLRALAAMAGLSRFHFLRLFRATTGMCPHQYIIALRLRSAAERLRSSTEPVTAIALDVGFNDLSHFNLLFRRRFGEAPRQWRMRS